MQDTAATVLGAVGIGVPDGGGVSAGPPVPSPAATTTIAPDETATPVIVADTTVEAEATPPIGTGVTVAATNVARAAPVPPPAKPGPSREGDDAKPGSGGPDQTDGATPAPHGSSGKATGQEADHASPGPAGKNHEPAAGATKSKPPKPPKETAGVG